MIKDGNTIVNGQICEFVNLPNECDDCNTCPHAKRYAKTF